MNIRINRSSQTPIYLQIKCAIQNLILSGELSPGYKMPAERKLAGELDIHRNTVIKAYGELVDEGYLIVSSKRPKGLLCQRRLPTTECHSSAFSRWRK